MATTTKRQRRRCNFLVRLTLPLLVFASRFALSIEPRDQEAYFQQPHSTSRNNLPDDVRRLYRLGYVGKQVHCERNKNWTLREVCSSRVTSTQFPRITMLSSSKLLSVDIQFSFDRLSFAFLLCCGDSYGQSCTRFSKPLSFFRLFKTQNTSSLPPGKAQILH